MKIGICGRMASGKTTLANHLVENHGFKTRSLAAPVKHIGKWLFGNETKDRKLLQQIGMKMREIDEDVWLDYLIRDTKSEGLFVVDDVRFINEAKQLKEQGWVLVKLDITPELQRDRLKKTYGVAWESHANRSNDPSEAEVSQIADELFDLIIEVEDGDNVFEKLDAQFGMDFSGQGSNATYEPSAR